MTFKVGDKVEVTENYDSHEVGEIGTVTSISSDTNPYYRINGDKWGAPARKFKKVEDKPMFKIGAKVKIIANTNGSRNKVGDIGVITQKSAYSGNWVVEVPGRKEENPHIGANTKESEMVLVEDDIYEDGWILNDGKVTIPDDAQKSMHEGSVVAFRKRKVVPLVFGDELTSDTQTYKFIRYSNNNKDKVDIFNPKSNTVLQDIYLSVLKRK